MKEVVLVTAYTPDDERINHLINTVNFLTENNYDVILINHSSNTPEYIIKKCKYYLYSSDNNLIDLFEARQFNHRYTKDLCYGSKLIDVYKHTTLPIYNMLYLGMSIAKVLGYDILHYVEYDIILQNTNLLKHSSEIIKNGYDVFYIEHHEYELFGVFFTIKTSSKNFDELYYDETHLTNLLKKHFTTERITKDYFFSNKEVYKFDYNLLPEYGCNYAAYRHVKNDGIFVFPALFDDKIQIVHDNQNTSDENLLVIINDEHVFTHNTKKGTFTIFPVSEVESTKKITIIVNDELVSTYETDTKEKMDYIFQNCFVKRL